MQNFCQKDTSLPMGIQLLFFIISYIGVVVVIKKKKKSKKKYRLSAARRERRSKILKFSKKNPAFDQTKIPDCGKHQRQEVVSGVKETQI